MTHTIEKSLEELDKTIWASASIRVKEAWFSIGFVSEVHHNYEAIEN